jgi:uncharacterized protein (TIGR00645 family)
MRNSILGRIVFTSRWILYPVNIGLLLALVLYVVQFLVQVYHFLVFESHSSTEAMMVSLLGFVDAFMVANLIVMIAQGSHQIFIQKFEFEDHSKIPQYLDHIDSGILKVKVALSISGITLVQLLRDFMNLEKAIWEDVVHRCILHGMTLVSALVVAIIWRVTHPPKGVEHA